MLKVIVPWFAAVPAPGALYVVKVLGEAQPETHWKP
jgi:hypothetical protein